MKSIRIVLAVLMLMALTVSLAAPVGCAGERARSKVLFPVLGHTVGSVRADVDRGLALQDEGPAKDSTIVVVNEFFGAIDAGDPDGMTPVYPAAWGVVESLGVRGIEWRLANGELGPNGAESFRVQLREFGDAVRIWSGN